MTLCGVVVFVSLFFVSAGYGPFADKKWGPGINNKVAWFLMELPIFSLMTLLWWLSERTFYPGIIAIFLIFQMHYFQRTFVFPFLIRGKSKTPLSIIFMGWIFNGLNALMQGGWIFYLSPDDLYTKEYLLSPQFIIGTAIFLAGFVINLHSDYIIRHLRAEGDTAHHIPYGGFFRYVTSANYLGEVLEWVGFAILTWSLPGLVFAWWTFANLAPRAHRLRGWYCERFGDEFRSLNRKRILPWIF